MKEGRSSDSVEYISDESGDDVEEHGDQDKLSNFNEPESDHSGESPVLKRGRKRNPLSVKSPSALTDESKQRFICTISTR